jgi:hypothetical protein
LAIANSQSAIRNPQSVLRLSITFALFICLTSPFATSAELQWRKAGPKRSTPSAGSQPISAATPIVTPTVRRDGAVRAVAFEDDGRAEFEGPSLTAQQAGGAESRSVMVENDAAIESRGSVRSAQLQFQSQSETDNRYEQQVAEPFGPPTIESESTEVDMSEEDILLPPTGESQDDTTAPEMFERQPRTFQPAPQRNAPRPDPFVEADMEPNAGLPGVDDTTLSDEGAEAEAYCSQELADLKANTLDQVDLNIAIAGRPGQDYPYECTFGDTWHEGRCWEETTYMWKASALCHKPLYFEDVALERYGHSWGPYLDPLVSGAHFFGTLPVLPYCMGLHPPNECMYALGYYRPGNCAPYMIPPVPFSCRAAAVQAGVTTGAVFLIP